MFVVDAVVPLHITTNLVSFTLHAWNGAALVVPVVAIVTTPPNVGEFLSVFNVNSWPTIPVNAASELYRITAVVADSLIIRGRALFEDAGVVSACAGV